MCKLWKTNVEHNAEQNNPCSNTETHIKRDFHVHESIAPVHAGSVPNTVPLIT